MIKYREPPVKTVDRGALLAVYLVDQTGISVEEARDLIEVIGFDRASLSIRFQQRPPFRVQSRPPLR
jgi:hypothetical protein